MESLNPQVVFAAKLHILNPNEFDLIVDSVVKSIAPTTAEQRLAKKNELKARGTLLMALPDKHQLKFNIHKDAMTLMEAIKKRFGDVMGSFASSQNTQNITFVSSNNTDSTNESVSAVASVSAASSKDPVSTLLNVDSLSDVVIYSFFASANRPAAIRFDMSKVECYNCHRRGHFSRECRTPMDNRNKEAPRKIVPVEVSTSNAMVCSSSSLGSDNEVASCSKACLESVEARLVVYQQNETVFEDDIKLLKLDVLSQIRDSLGYDSQVFDRHVFNYEELHSDESVNSVSTSPVNDRYKAGKGYHAVPPPYTRTFMPLKPNLVFNEAHTASESIANVVPVELNTNKPSKDMSLRPDAPIIKDCTFDSKDESEIESVPKQKEPSFVLIFKHVKTPRESVKTVEHPKQAENLRTKNQKSKGHKNSWNKKACFVYRSLNHLIKDCDYYKKKIVQKPVWNSAMRGNPQQALKDKGVIDSGCSRHMAGNISFILDFEEINGGYVAFGRNPKVELNFNLFSVSQMCDKKNNVIFTDTECVVLSSDYKLPDENHVLLRVPRENNMYNVYLKNVVPLGDLTCLFAKATLDESNLWHRRLGHINFKTINKLVKGNLVRGLPSKIFKNNHTCVACKKGKQHRASCKSKPASSVCQPLQRVLLTKPHNKTPYELLLGRSPSIGFMRPFGCPVTILNTLDLLGKFDGKADEGFLVGYSINRIGPKWLFDIDTLTQSMNYQTVVAGNQPNNNAGIKENLDASKVEKETVSVQQYVLLPLWSTGSQDPQNTDDAD
nr:putative ribonuclease H-like domain-containing protein [Tanacetum cinerariifolium]